MIPSDAAWLSYDSSSLRTDTLFANPTPPRSVPYKNDDSQEESRRGNAPGSGPLKSKNAGIALITSRVK